MRQGNTLSAILVARHLCDDLRRDVACCRKTVGLFDQGPADNSPVLEHVLQIDQIAVVHVLRIVIRIMEVDDPGLIRLNDILRQEHPLGQVTADLPRHIVPLDTVDRRVLV